MITFRPLVPEDLEGFRLTGGQQSFANLMCREYGEVLAEMPFATTALDDGVPVALFGLQHLWQGRGLVWAFIGDSMGSSMITITRKCRNMLSEAGYPRIEMHVEAGFGAGERWAEMLGFQLEGKMSRFFPDGSDATMWARIDG